MAPLKVEKVSRIQTRTAGPIPAHERTTAPPSVWRSGDRVETMNLWMQVLDLKSGLTKWESSSQRGWELYWTKKSS